MSAVLADKTFEQIALPDTRLLINGERREAVAGKRFETLNPASGAVITDVALAEAADIDLAVKAARAALDAPLWKHMTGAQRGRILNKLADLLELHREDLVQLESLDAGKPLAATRRQDIPAAIDCLRYYAGWADKIDGVVVPARADALTYVKREPVGVVAAIVPWNFPLMNAVWKVAPALRAGHVLPQGRVERAARGPDRQVDVGRFGQRHLDDLLAGGRVEGGEALARRAFEALAVDQQAGVRQGDLRGGEMEVFVCNCGGHEATPSMVMLPSWGAHRHASNEFCPGRDWKALSAVTRLTWIRPAWPAPTGRQRRSVSRAAPRPAPGSAAAAACGPG